MQGEWQKKIQTYFSIQLRHVLTVTSYIKILELLFYLGNEKWEIGNIVFLTCKKCQLI
jgi:hypothetical protein